MTNDPLFPPSAIPILEAPPEALTTIRSKVQNTLAQAKSEVHQHPIPILFGALLLGMAAGCAVALMRRDEPTLRERLVDEPLASFRDAIYDALSPVADRLHGEYAAARDGVQRHLPHREQRWTDSLNRVSRHLKFW